MGEMTNKTQADVLDLAAVVAAGAKGEDLVRFRELAVANGFEGRSGGWVYDTKRPGAPAISHGWSSFAGAVRRGAVELLVGGTPAPAPTEPAAADRGIPRRLNFRPAAGVPPKLHAEGATVYEAEAEGVKYRIVGSIVDPIAGNGRRAFRAYRLVGKTGHTLHPAGRGGELRKLWHAFEEAERDLVEVLRDRRTAQVDRETAYLDVEGQHFETVTEREERLAGKLAAHIAVKPDGLYQRVGRLVARTCCASTEGDVHDRTCYTSEAREQWRPRSSRPASRFAPGNRPALDAGGPDEVDRHGGRPESSPYRRIDGAFEIIEQAVRDLVAAEPAPMADPAVDDDSNELLDRIVRRAQYTALHAMLGVLDGWIEGAAENHEAMSHRDNDCCRDFAPADIRRMINDAAAELGVPAPYVPEPDLGPQYVPGDRVVKSSVGGEVLTVDRVAVIAGSGGRQQFWAPGEHIARHSDEYRVVEIGAGR